MAEEVNAELVKHDREVQSLQAAVGALETRVEAETEARRHAEEHVRETETENAALSMEVAKQVAAEEAAAAAALAAEEARLAKASKAGAGSVTGSRNVAAWLAGWSTVAARQPLERKQATARAVASPILCVSPRSEGPHTPKTADASPIPPSSVDSWAWAHAAEGSLLRVAEQADAARGGVGGRADRDVEGSVSGPQSVAAWLTSPGSLLPEFSSAPSSPSSRREVEEVQASSRRWRQVDARKGGADGLSLRLSFEEATEPEEPQDTDAQGSEALQLLGERLDQLSPEKARRTRQQGEELPNDTHKDEEFDALIAALSGAQGVAKEDVVGLGPPSGKGREGLLAYFTDVVPSPAAKLALGAPTPDNKPEQAEEPTIRTKLVCPESSQPGEVAIASTANGGKVKVRIPPGTSPGSEFEVVLPKDAAQRRRRKAPGSGRKARPPPPPGKPDRLLKGRGSSSGSRRRGTRKERPPPPPNKPASAKKRASSQKRRTKPRKHEAEPDRTNETAAVPESTERSNEAAMAAAEESASHAAVAVPVAPPPKPLWQAAVDPTSGRTYYFNRQTRETSWKPPLQENSSNAQRVDHERGQDRLQGKLDVPLTMDRPLPQLGAC